MEIDEYDYEQHAHGNLQEYLSFKDGELDFGAYSYYIDSYGNGSLSKEETYKLYLVMKNYYEKLEKTVDTPSSL